MGIASAVFMPRTSSLFWKSVHEPPRFHDLWRMMQYALHSPARCLCRAVHCYTRFGPVSSFCVCVCVFVFFFVAVCVFILSFAIFKIGFATSQWENSPYSSLKFTDPFPKPPHPLKSFRIRSDLFPLKDSLELIGSLSLKRIRRTLMAGVKSGQQMGRKYSASIYHQVKVFGRRIKGDYFPFTF